MEREIKFRAWDVELKVMFHVDTISFVQGGIFIQDGATISTFNAILMQYTGFKDKNGVEIYEGDILQSFHNIYKPVIFENACFTWHGEPLGYEVEEYVNEPSNQKTWATVIGNIQENPELI